MVVDKVPASRFRLPTRSRAPQVVAATLITFVGAVLAVVVVTLGLEQVLLVASVLLFAAGVVLAGWAWLDHRRRRWVVWVGAQHLTLVRRQRRHELSWTDIGDVRVTGHRLVITNASGAVRQALPITGDVGPTARPPTCST